MPKAKRKSHYNIEITKWKRYYSKIKEVHSPAIDKPILFSNYGWEHLVGGKFRTTREQIRRLELLPIAKKLLEKATTYQDIRFQNHHDHYNLTAHIQNMKITVVVREDKKKFYFYSVFRT